MNSNPLEDAICGLTTAPTPSSESPTMYVPPEGISKSECTKRSQRLSYQGGNFIVNSTVSEVPCEVDGNLFIMGLSQSGLNTKGLVHVHGSIVATVGPRFNFCVSLIYMLC